MKDQWLGMEQYRLRLVEEWPESPRKKVVIAAILSSIQSLSRATPDTAIQSEPVYIIRAA